MKIDTSTHIPRRAPRLPRDHFAMRPPTTLLSRIIQAVIVVCAAIGLYVFFRR